VDLGGSQCEEKIDGLVKENVFCGRVVHCRIAISESVNVFILVAVCKIK
jgi:hypothetical protein